MQNSAKPTREEALEVTTNAVTQRAMIEARAIGRRMVAADDEVDAEKSAEALQALVDQAQAHDMGY